MRFVVAGVLFPLLLLFSVVMFSAYREKHKKLSYDIVLPVMVGENKKFDTTEIKRKGRMHIVNVFASWCIACIEEHNVWKEIVKDKSIDLYGIDYIDIEENALSWLQKHGNPYIAVGSDYLGRSAKAFGVTGVPETFVFNENGELLLHISGAVTKDLWQKDISRLVSKR